MVTTELLRAELERAFDLNELMSLSRELLGFDPEQVGGTAAAGSFAGALISHCLERDAIEALCDAMLASKAELNQQIHYIRVNGLGHDDRLEVGAKLGDITIERQLGEGRIGVCYVGRQGDRERRLKVLRREATRDRRGLHRFLTVTRLLGGVDHPGLPKRVAVEQIGERTVIVHDYVEGSTLATRLGRSGPMHLNEARPLLLSILDALRSIHERRLAHGDLRLENVLVYRGEGGSQQVLLLDAGSDRLRARARVSNGHSELFSTVGSPRTVAPEQIRGAASDPRSDVYSFAALSYELLTGQPAFGAGTALEAAIGHLTVEPKAPSSVAPHGWISRALDDFLLGLLAKDPARRPKDAAELRERLETLDQVKATSDGPKISDAELDDLVNAVLADAASEEAVLALETATSRGADPGRVAEALCLAAAEFETEDDVQRRAVKKGLLLRGARLYEHAAENPEQAEHVYVRLLELDAEDEHGNAGLMELRRKLGKWEELVEMLLAKSERIHTAEGKARCMAEIGRVYARELGEPEQALVALVQAVCEEPDRAEYAEEVERIAGDRRDAWSEVLESLGHASLDTERPLEHKHAVLARAAEWYQKKLGDTDMALSCYQSIVASEPAHDAALEGMARLYRKAQKWPELVTVLGRRADSAEAPTKARDLRAEAAEILEQQQNDTGRARDLYEQVLAADPGHERAAEALVRIYQRSGDHPNLVKVLEHRAQAQRGEERLKTLCRIAELYEDQLDDAAEAARRYDLVLEQDAHSLEALRGLDRLYVKAGRFQDLLGNLEAQLTLSPTPRQKIALLLRIAGIYEEEFLDHQRAADALDKVLTIDPAHQAALTDLIRHHRALSRWDDVARHYDRLLELATEPARRLELTLTRGRVLVDNLGSPERAAAAFELALEIEPGHAGALEALARLRERSGDADAALKAIEALAQSTQSAEARAEQYVRAAKLLESRGDRDGAILRYKLALDANPKDVVVAQALREAYVTRGDINAAIDLLEHQLEVAEGDRAKAKLAGEIARLALVRLKDVSRAEEAARRALALDPSELAALLVLGDIAFDNSRFVEAARHYEALASRADLLEQTETVRVLIRYVDCLTQIGSTEKALAPMDTLLRIAPDDIDALSRVAQVTFEHGSPSRAASLYQDLLRRFADRLDEGDRALSKYRYGEALRRAGQIDEAITVLEEASELDTAAVPPLVSLAQAYESKEAWEKVLGAKTRQLDLAIAESRAQLLIEIGDIASGKLGDRTRAAKSFVAALEDRPDDRKVLTKLMQLYSEEKDWNKLVEVVLRLADFVDDPKQKIKYLQTAAAVSAKQMADLDRALGLYNQVLDIDPSLSGVLNEAIDLERGRGAHAGVERLLQRRLALATESKDETLMLATFTELGQLYEKHLGLMDRAIDAYEAAHTLDPDNLERTEMLAGLYSADPEHHLDKAIAAHTTLLRTNAYRAETYRALRKLYTEAKRADGAWCLCQALSTLNLAEPDEERFFKRMRAETAAPAQAVLTDEDWLHQLMHAGADPLLTSVFALIEPSIIAVRGQPLEALGYAPTYAIDLARHPYPISQTLFWASSVLGLEAPPTFQNMNDPGGLSYLHAHTPALVLGHMALHAEVPPQAAAFVAARQLTYFRPGMYVRQLVPLGTGLKAWLFAAIKLIVPTFPIGPDLEGSVKEDLESLEASMPRAAREHLARIVSKLIQNGAALDLKRWVAAIDLTADRAGLLLAHDLEVATELVKASDEGSSSVPGEERVKELLLYSVSEQYLGLRKKLGVAIDS